MICQAGMSLFGMLFGLMQTFRRVRNKIIGADCFGQHTVTYPLALLKCSQVASEC